MANFGAKILNNATGALQAHQAVIASIGNNIANVNTPGYARRLVDLQTRVTNGVSGTINIGNGVEIGGIVRVADKFVEQVLREAGGSVGSSSVELDFMKRLESLFTVTDNRITIGSSLSEFFTSVNQLTTNPADLELRANVMERATDVVEALKGTFSQIASMQDEADGRIASELDNVNSITVQIANLNGLISSREAGGITASDERDQRDLLINKLGEKLTFSTVETSDGTVTISLSNGFPLVNGTTSRDLGFTNSPSFAPGVMPPSLSGGVLRHIVFDYDPTGGQSHLDLTQVIKAGEGVIGGLLHLRGYNDPANGGTAQAAFQGDGIFIEMASRVEAVTRTLLTTFNDTYIGPDEDNTTVGRQPSSRDLNGNAPTGLPFSFFDFNYSAGAKDVDGDGNPEIADLNALGVAGVDNFTSLLQLRFTDPAQFAAARDSDPTTQGTVSFQQGNGANATALFAMRSTNYTFSTGSFSLTTTFEGMYNESVTHVGNTKARANLESSVADATLTTAQSKRDEISAVSLDEEFSKMIQFQKVYQASARMIRIASDLLDQVVDLI